jgi:hypothetical protein
MRLFSTLRIHALRPELEGLGYRRRCHPDVGWLLSSLYLSLSLSLSSSSLSYRLWWRRV